VLGNSGGASGLGPGAEGNEQKKKEEKREGKKRKENGAERNEATSSLRTRALRDFPRPSRLQQPAAIDVVFCETAM